MNNHQLSKLTVILLASISLLACNGGNSSSNTNSATAANPLQQYINLLTYTPTRGKQLSGSPGSNQQSFSTPGGIQINSVDIKYYSGADCSGTATLATTLNGPSTPPAGIYTSSNTSNYALCGKYSGGCGGLYNAVHANPPAVRSMQYTYNLNNGVFTTQCLSNPNNNPYGTGAFETILNYSQNPPVACAPGGSCGYSQSYSATSLFTQIALPQTGQTPTIPITATLGMDGYTYLGVPWAYVTSGTTTPPTRFTADPVDSNCIIDNLTGLEWPKNGIIGFKAIADGDPIAQPDYANTTNTLNNLYWTLALTAVANMNSAHIKLCGYSDWRLPNVNELVSLVNQGMNSSSFLLAEGFSNVQSVGGYWSSTTNANNAGSAWLVMMNEGIVTVENKPTTYRFVWPVRGGQ